MKSTVTKMDCKKKTKWKEVFWKTGGKYGCSIYSLILLRDYRSERYLKKVGWLS